MLHVAIKKTYYLSNFIFLKNLNLNLTKNLKWKIL